MAGSLEEANAWLVRAEEALEAAEVLVECGLYNDSISRAYYAMFYAASAAVVSEGVRSKKHSGIISAFGHLFAKTGRLDPEWHRALIQASKEREAADYRPGAIIQEDRVRERLSAAEKFLQAIKTLLGT